MTFDYSGDNRHRPFTSPEDERTHASCPENNHFTCVMCEPQPHTHAAHAGRCFSPDAPTPHSLALVHCIVKSSALGVLLLVGFLLAQSEAAPRLSECARSICSIRSRWRAAPRARGCGRPLRGPWPVGIQYQPTAEFSKLSTVSVSLAGIPKFRPYLLPQASACGAGPESGSDPFLLIT